MSYNLPMTGKLHRGISLAYAKGSVDVLETALNIQPVKLLQDSNRRI